MEMVEWKSLATGASLTATISQTISCLRIEGRNGFAVRIEEIGRATNPYRR
jgi:hypothetical protein